MRTPLLTGWNAMRVLYLIVGLGFVAEAMLSKQWIGLLPGTYFASMSIFRFGCASGTCLPSPRSFRHAPANEIEYSEIKQQES